MRPRPSGKECGKRIARICTHTVATGVRYVRAGYKPAAISAELLDEVDYVAYCVLRESIWRAISWASSSALIRVWSCRAWARISSKGGATLV